ncbi:aminomethyl-transferring glycine dehydrogenase [Bacteroidales bacterium OttesenSCG-928-K03]|nr:aminomethyl-transferring glycine dehydrogenase [Bacteroidales bacterium OttesenSCG-928-L14]MDL2240349.1 aminomethyl-transferring glycine dehydrogenase [Bacteroidales bacterium OttesenSCG-928-K22]MDL2242502.1 aminomethyl-transferring glycine dehydrogenase [Bacteroidales bacterium OttesenSCG-928-K03]
MITNNFINRHLGPDNEQTAKMLEKIGVSSIDELINLTIPQKIRFKEDLDLQDGLNEYEYVSYLKGLASKNKIFKSFIGLGYYNTILPGVIQRNVLENPGWYTAYTPYQAEISQGRLEALLIFQTMISDLTGMPVSNCSLLDEGTAAAEAMIMSFNVRTREKMKRGDNKFFISKDLFPQSIAVIKTRAEYLGIDITIGDETEFDFADEYFGAILQYPNAFGEINDYAWFTEKAHEKNIIVSVAADLMSLTLLTPPGEWNADIVIGSAQRFGTPMGYGGAHAAFLATKDDFKRKMPGRIIGVSKDRLGNKAFRMALQTREQHIKRHEATSNICTAQALMAMMSGFYAVYHGPEGLKQIARHINILAIVLSDKLKELGVTQLNEQFFDTIHLLLPNNISTENINNEALLKEMNFRVISENEISISIDETTTLDDVNTIIEIFAQILGKEYKPFVCDKNICDKLNSIKGKLNRESKYLTAEVFNKYHSETAMMRFLKYLENKDLSLNRAMIPLGSCTMKLNAASWMFFLSWPEFANLHPFAPQNQALGYKDLIDKYSEILEKITGFAGVSFQANSGAAGEYAGLMTIRAYQKDNGQSHRNVCLIPASAHGTNPASAAMAGLKIVVTKTDENGNVDLNDFKAKAEEFKDNLSCTMITYPSTHGVFEEDILEIVKIIHDAGGQVYMDGANMNAQVGYTSPGYIGADVCHLNLHKTFGSPHGGGGPGVGPIGVAKHLVPYLPSNPIVNIGTEKSFGAVSSAPYGSAFIIPISFGYCMMLGGDGLKKATAMAILNANYLRKSLENHYKILYVGSKGMCAHEMILDCNEFKKTVNLEVIDLAKRLMDYGFHAPTVAFPVHGTLMVEPTESEPLSELDRFVEAMISIREEIKDIEESRAEVDNNCIKNAPHTCEIATSEEWTLPYSRTKACFPLGYFDGKYWPAVTKIDDAFGDRNLVTIW